MAVNRVERINSLLEKEIGSIILREVMFPSNTLVTVTSVRSSANLIEAKVFVSAFPEDRMDTVMDILNRHVFHIQKEINYKLNMRPIPKIIFVRDSNASQAAKVEEALHKLSHPD